MTAPRYARHASRILKRAAAVDSPYEPPSGDREEAALRAVREAIERTARRRSRMHRAGAVLALSAVAAATVIGIAHRRSAPVTSTTAPRDVTVTAHAVGRADVALEGEAEKTLLEDTHLPSGTKIVAREGGGVTLALSTGTRLALESYSKLTLVDEGETERFDLVEGGVRANVAKLQPSQRFIIATSDAEIEVHGTSFRVSLVEPDPTCGNGVRTRVQVLEGVVTVRAQGHEWSVTAEAPWPPNCAREAAAAPTPPPDERHVPKNAPSTPAAASKTSSLSAQNDLFERAVTAKRKGRSEEAAALFARFVDEFPSSPLAENAAFERVKALRLTNPSAATQAARSYLVTYPKGFARAEVEAIAEGP